MVAENINQTKINIKSKQNTLVKVLKYKCLGTQFTEDGRSIEEIKTRICLGNIFWGSERTDVQKCIVNNKKETVKSLM